MACTVFTIARMVGLLLGALFFIVGAQAIFYLGVDDGLIAHVGTLSILTILPLSYLSSRAPRLCGAGMILGPPLFWGGMRSLVQRYGGIWGTDWIEIAVMLTWLAVGVVFLAVPPCPSASAHPDSDGA